MALRAPKKEFSVPVTSFSYPIIRYAAPRYLVINTRYRHQAGQAYLITILHILCR